jgi:hypothetical protein
MSEAAAYQKKRLREQIEEIKARLVALDSFGQDDWPIGTVLTFDKQYGGRPTGTKYRFAAIKTGFTSWYVTGRNSGPMTWESLTSLILDRENEIPSVWWTSEWTEMA